MRAVFPQDDEEFSFTMVEFEVMCSCASGDVCQTFRVAHCNVGVGGRWGKREEQLGVICIKVVRESM